MGRELHFPELTIFLKVELALNASHQHKKVRKKKERKKKKSHHTVFGQSGRFFIFGVYHISCFFS